MCLITSKNNYIRTTKKDIVVYKLLSKQQDRGIVRAWLNVYFYKLNMLHKQDIKLSKINVNPFLDNVHSSFIYEKFGLFDKKGVREMFKIYSEGFHSFTKLKRLKLLTSAKYNDIYKCIIPKGSQYIRGYTDLIVSNQIIIKEKIKTEKE